MKKQQIRLGKKLQLTKETLLVLESQRQIAGGALTRLPAACGATRNGETCATFRPNSPYCRLCEIEP
ncbi:hypothetical protein [Taibaiella koreensis]|uniref:hypothetical protein n=1 Tax=Taibaiella koreensis TaxID=1268548 RepID=UPI000E59B318|nr:hypothetical protein [Taibaiella koreensis]